HSRPPTLSLHDALPISRTAVDCVPGGEDLRIGRPAALVDGLEQRAELVARPLADRLHDRVDGDDELAAGDGLRPAAAALVRRAEDRKSTRLNSSHLGIS